MAGSPAGSLFPAQRTLAEIQKPADVTQSRGRKPLPNSGKLVPTTHFSVTVSLSSEEQFP